MFIGRIYIIYILLNAYWSYISFFNSLSLVCIQFKAMFPSPSLNRFKLSLGNAKFKYVTDRDKTRKQVSLNKNQYLRVSIVLPEEALDKMAEQHC